jgi:hypothetical protein
MSLLSREGNVVIPVGVRGDQNLPQYEVVAQRIIKTAEAQK